MPRAKHPVRMIAISLTGIALVGGVALGLSGCSRGDSTTPNESSQYLSSTMVTLPDGSRVACVYHYSGGVDCAFPVEAK